MTRLLFASTARAGKFNHRYLVPHSDSHLDPDLASFSNGASPFVVRESVKVNQSGGRTGNEMIVLVDDRLTSLNEQGREEVKSLLRRQLLQLERLVTEIMDWSQWPGGPPPVVPCGQLDVWQTEADTLLTRLSANPLIVTEPSHSSPRWLALLRVAGIPIATLILVCVALIVWAQLPKDGRTRNRGGTEKGRRTTNDPVALPPNDDKLFNELATSVGFPVTKPYTDAMCMELAKRLEDQLFGGLDQTEVNPEQEAQQRESKVQGRHRLSNVLKAVGTTVGKSEVTDWKDFGLYDQLEKLFSAPGKTFNARGLLELKSGEDVVLGEISPQRIWPVIQQLHTLHQKVSPLDRGQLIGNYGAFFSDVRKYQIELPVTGPVSGDRIPVPRRKYFVAADLVALRRLNNLLRTDSANKLCNKTGEKESTSLPSPSSASELFGAVDLAAKDSENWLHPDQLKRKVGEFRDRNEDKAMKEAHEALSAFIRACRDAAKVTPSTADDAPAS